MELIKLEVEGTKETHEIGLAVRNVIAAYTKAKEDGWQLGQDVPAILMASYTSLTEAIDGADQVKGEFQKEPYKAALGALIPLMEGVELLGK